MLNDFIPIDKSSAIRAFLFSLLTEREIEITADGELPLDAVSALESLEFFGKKVRKNGNLFKISGKTGKPCRPVFCGNSATVMHILMGLGVYLGFDPELTGDESLMSRNHGDFYDAKKLYGSGFVETALTKESAQLKSFHLISMLKSGGKLHFRYRTRRNTEDFLLKMGVEIVENENMITVFPADSLNGFSVSLKKDPSSAFIAACASLICEKPFEISDIYLDETRIVPFILLRNAGYDLNMSEEKDSFSVAGTPKFCDIGRNIEISENQVPEIIDEIPFVAFMTARIGKSFSVKGAKWLRNKESDRIEESVKRLSPLFETAEYDDGFAVCGSAGKILKTEPPHSSDHRMEMLSALISIDSGIDFKMNGSHKISFPLFCEMIEFLRKNGR